MARKLDGYGEITFPHCASDARKEGHIMCIVGYDSFKLQACHEDGAIEVKKINQKKINEILKNNYFKILE